MAKTKASSISSSHSATHDHNPENLESKVVPLHPNGLHSPANALHANGAAVDNSRPTTITETAEKIKELLRLAQEQGYLTYGDISETLPDTIASPEEIEQIIIQLRNLEVEIVDQAEVDRVKQPNEEEEEKTRLDVLDDPVRMYLKQMGQVALLTREQEVEISKRIEDAEEEIQKIICCLGFAAKEHVALTEKLVCEPPKERFDRVVLDKMVEGREKHLKALGKLVAHVQQLDHQVDVEYAKSRKGTPSGDFLAKYRKLNRKLHGLFVKFCFKQKVMEEMVIVAENIHDKMQSCL